MLESIDRVQMAVPDRAAAAAGWVDLLGAEPEGDDHVDALGADRSRYRLGDGWIELLEPTGPGPVAEAVDRRGGHLFAAGAATTDLDGLIGHLRERGVADVILCGLARDVCVRWTAEDAAAEGFRVWFVWDATRAVDPAADEATRAALASRGVRVVTTRELLG